jgi:3-hydroxybutyryl-CoA dehydrogenase
MRFEDVKTVSVFGAGLMGSGIAQVFAQQGYTVYMRARHEKSLDDGLAAINKSLMKLTEKAVITPEQAKATVSLIKITTSLEEAAGAADFVVETIPEKIPVKKELYMSIEPFMKPEAILSTNTSTLSITDLASSFARPEQFIGMHFFIPVPLMKLVEMIRGLMSSDETTEVTKKLAIKLGKEPVIVHDMPGFATTRLGTIFFLEASHMLEEGVASVADIDKAMKLGYGHRMGPFETCDLVGLDARLNNLIGIFQATGDPKWAPPQLLKKLVIAGYIGKKPGSRGGYYKYFGLE